MKNATQQILEACKKYKWIIKPGIRTGLIRTARKNRCPLQVFTKQQLGYHIVAEERGVPGRVVTSFMNAADGWGSPVLRAKMLKAFGLEGK